MQQTSIHLEIATKEPCHTGRNLKRFNGNGKDVLPNFLCTVREHLKPPFKVAKPADNHLYIEKGSVGTFRGHFILSLEVPEHHE